MRGAASEEDAAAGRAPAGLLVAYALSGACALAFQVVWYHAFTEQLGASGTTFLVVLCAFIGGLGLGAVFSKRVYAAVERRFGGRGLRNYGRTELLVSLSSMALYGLTTPSLAGLLGRFPYRLHRVDGVALFEPTLLYDLLRIGLAAVAVGVPCFLMGLTYPYLCSLFPRDGRLPSRLYAANTFGAALAVLGTEFGGLALLGYLGCFALAVAGTLGLGLFFVRFPAWAGLPASAEEKASRAPREPLSVYPAVLSGFLCGGLQSLAYVLVRLLLGPTRGTFALLAFFSILGIWLASTAVHRSAPSPRLLAAAAWTGLAAALIPLLAQPRLSESLIVWAAESGTFASARTAAFAASALGTGFLIFVPYLLWSTLLPALCDRKQQAGENLSATYGLNTLAFLAGVLAFGWALQYVHVFYATRVFFVAAFLGLLLLSFVPSGGAPARPGRYVAAAGALGASLLAIPLSRRMDLVGGGQGDGAVPGAYLSSPQHLYWVRVNRADGSQSLMFDSYSMSGTTAGSITYMRAMAHLPILVGGEPREVLLICFGVGETADAIRRHPALRRLDVVDLSREVFLMNHYFRQFNGDVLADPRLRAVCDDGRQFLKLTGESYDFVTLEPPPPLQPGVSRLYSMEFYAAVRERLKKGGVVSQWLPEMQMDREGVALIVSTFLRSFRHAFLFVGWGRDLILVGSDEPFGFGRLAERLAAAPEVLAELSRLGLGTAPRLLATILRTDAGLRRTWGDGPVIRDGFVSLETLQISSPVQRLHPAGGFLALKPELVYDVPELLAMLRREAPAEAPAVEELLSRTESLPRTVPPWYVPGVPLPAR